MDGRVLPKRLTITRALALSLCMLAFLVVASKQAHALEDGYRTDEVIVRPVPGVTIGQIIADYPTSKLLDAGLPYNLETRNVYLLKAPDGKDAKDFARELEADPQGRVDMAEANFVAVTPEDPADNTYGDGRMRARGITFRRQNKWANTTFATSLNLNAPSCERNITGATVAVLDTGAQLDHPALRGNFRGVRRYDFVQNDWNPSDGWFGLDVEPNGVKDQLRGHGTHVAGIVDQVAPAAKIAPLRVLNSEGYGEVYDVARAISFAQAQGVDVINLSLGTSEPSELLYEMVAEATGRGIVVAAAAGNENSPDEHYPAAGASGTTYDPLLLDPTKDGLLAVTSLLDKEKVKSDFASYGLWVDIAAPGENIRSAFPRDKYANWSGTSMATPFISGQAALIHASDAALEPAAIEAAIRRTAESIYPPEKLDQNVEHVGKLGAGLADVCGSIPDDEG